MCGALLYKLVNLQTLKLIYYNQPLKSSLYNLVNLQTLELIFYNHFFENSLDHLTNLKMLTLNNDYIDSLDHVHTKLTNLKINREEDLF